MSSTMQNVENQALENTIRINNSEIVIDDNSAWAYKCAKAPNLLPTEREECIKNSTSSNSSGMPYVIYKLVIDNVLNIVIGRQLIEACDEEGIVIPNEVKRKFKYQQVTRKIEIDIHEQ